MRRSKQGPPGVLGSDRYIDWEIISENRRPPSFEVTRNIGIPLQHLGLSSDRSSSANLLYFPPLPSLLLIRAGTQSPFVT